MISDIDISIRLLLAAVLGSLIGFERERRPLTATQGVEKVEALPRPYRQVAPAD
jgi:hypothetical protein